MNTRLLLSVVALAALGAAIALSASAQATGDVQPSANAKRLEIYLAQVTLINDVLVPAQEAGRLMKVHVKGGETIDENYLIAEIDNRDTVAKQKIAQGERDVAQAQADSEAELEVALEAVNVSQAELDASVEIQKKNPGAVTLTEIRKYRFQLERAKAQVKVAQTDLVVARLTTKVKDAQLEATDNELARRKITAPFKGEVNHVKRQVGEWVQPGEPIAHLVQLDKLRVIGLVYANAASAADVLGKPVEITITTAGSRVQTVKGKIDFASPVIEGSGSKGGEFRIWADIDNQKVVDPLTKKETWKIQPGTTASMSIDLSPPPPPKPATPLKAEPAKPASGTPGSTPGTVRPRSGLDARPAPATPATKIETLKPVASDPAKKPEETKSSEKKAEEKKPDEKQPEKKPDDKPAETKAKTKER